MNLTGGPHAFITIPLNNNGGVQMADTTKNAIYAAMDVVNVSN